MFSHGPICREKMPKCLGPLCENGQEGSCPKRDTSCFRIRPTSHLPPPSLVIPPWLPCHSSLGTTTFWQNSPNCSPPHSSPFASDFLFANHAFFLLPLLSRIRQLEQTSLRGNLIVSICTAVWRRMSDPSTRH